MKRLIFLLITLLVPIISLSVNYTSYNNHTGLWSSSSSWNGSAAPNDNINLAGGTLTINGFIKWQTTNPADSILSFGGGSGGTIVINDTLVIYGNLELGNKYDLVINGILIVYGDISSTNQINISSTGFLIVSGNMDFGGSKGVIAPGTESNVYIGGTCTNGTGCANTSNDTTDLAGTDINVNDFYHKNDPKGCPSTGPSYYVPNNKY